MGKCKVEFYQDKQGMWRWRAKAGNGRIVADSGEGYTRKRNAIHGLDVAAEVLEATLQQII